jgi:beta-glucosidase
MKNNAHEQGPTRQPEIVTTGIPGLETDGLQFRDLNRNGRLDPYEDWRRPVEERIDDLLAQMTLEEKAGLMVHPALAMGEQGALREEPLVRSIAPGTEHIMSPGTTDAILEKHIRHVLTRSHEGPEILATWNNNLQALAERSRLGIPVVISSDPRNGFRHDPNATSVRAGTFSQWPEPIGLAATGDADLVERFGKIVAQEYRATGIRTALHPMADLATEPRWGRIVGTFGEDAELAAELTAAYIRGFQGEGGVNPDSVTTMTKHFPGSGPQREGLDPHNEYGKEQVYPGDNFDHHLIPFKAAIEAKTAQMMPYYGIPMDVTGENVGMAFNKEILTGLLREKLGFDGVICTDWGVTSLMCWGVEELSVEERYKKAIEAGADQFGGDHTPEIIVKLVKGGEISESRINESVRRLLRVMFQLGLFENPYVDPELAREIVGNAEFQAAADLAQRKSIVLLKNKATTGGKTLPLGSETRVYVENVNPTVAAEYATVVEALEEADVAILRVETPFEIGPGFFGRIHHGNLAFQGKALEHIQETMRTKPTVVSIYLDRPAVIPEIARGAAALLGTFGAGDRALLDVVFGKFTPTGKLPFELPSSMEAVEKQREDVPYDSDDPLFEFGFGLTY